VIGLTHRIGFWSTHFSWFQRNCRVAILYFLAEEPIQNRQQQDCCLIVEVHAPDRVDDQWVQQAVCPTPILNAAPKLLADLALQDGFADRLEAEMPAQRGLSQ
jgi:hypothetical protein